MSAGIVEFPPLLPVGFHQMTLAELRDLCVTAFPLSTRRDPAMLSIEALCTSLSTALIRAEVWVDGSFLTQKLDPNDADLIVRIFSTIVDNATDVQKALLNRIAMKEFGNPVPCDSYLLIDFPKGHQQYATGDMMEGYWKKQFGFSRGQEFKGIAVIRTPLA